MIVRALIEAEVHGGEWLSKVVTRDWYGWLGKEGFLKALRVMAEEEMNWITDK